MHAQHMQLAKYETPNKGSDYSTSILGMEESSTIIPGFVEKIRVLAIEKLIFEGDESFKPDDFNLLRQVQRQIRFEIAKKARQ